MFFELWNLWSAPCFVSAFTYSVGTSFTGSWGLVHKGLRMSKFQSKGEVATAGCHQWVAGQVITYVLPWGSVCPAFKTKAALLPSPSLCHVSKPNGLGLAGESSLSSSDGWHRWELPSQWVWILLFQKQTLHLFVAEHAASPVLWLQSL